MSVFLGFAHSLLIMALERGGDAQGKRKKRKKGRDQLPSAFAALIVLGKGKKRKGKKKQKRKEGNVVKGVALFLLLVLPSPVLIFGWWPETGMSLKKGRGEKADGDRSRGQFSCAPSTLFSFRSPERGGGKGERGEALKRKKKEIRGINRCADTASFLAPRPQSVKKGSRGGKRGRGNQGGNLLAQTEKKSTTKKRRTRQYCCRIFFATCG